MKKRRKNMFFDCDGTLFEWNPLDEEQTGMLYTAIYYTSLSPLMVELIRDLSEQATLYVCSVCLCPDAKEGKNLALDRWYGSHTIPYSRRLFVPEGMSKAEYVMKTLNRELNEDDILFDDHSANLIDWEEHHGMAIKVLNGVNGKGIKWKGRRMTPDGKMDLSLFRGAGYPNEKAYAEIIYQTYEQAVRDYLRLKNNDSAEAEKEKNEIVKFLKDDWFRIGTGRILNRLGIA